MENKKTNDYEKLNVKTTKESLDEASGSLYKGVLPKAFCQIMPLPNNVEDDLQKKYFQIIHSSGVGTKSNVAYIAMQEGLGTQYLKRIPQDAIVMNTDDMACVGVTDNFYLTNHIARNAGRINDLVIADIIKGYDEYYQKMQSLGINLYNAGKDVMDVGSYTTTLGIDATASAILEKEKIINCAGIRENEFIVGLASYGQSTYEDYENSGMRSNGLTLAINSLLSPYYREYEECLDKTVLESKLFTGPYRLKDKLKGSDMTIVDALLSPTRTYLPILKQVLSSDIKVSGIIHCTNGGLTKSLNYGENISYIKRDLNKLIVPPIFKEIQACRGISDYNMYQTFNMGVGMEIIVPTLEDAQKIIAISQSFNVDAQVIGVTMYNKNGNAVEINGNSNLVYRQYKLKKNN